MQPCIYPCVCCRLGILSELGRLRFSFVLSLPVTELALVKCLPYGVPVKIGDRRSWEAPSLYLVQIRRLKKWSRASEWTRGDRPPEPEGACAACPFPGTPGPGLLDTVHWPSLSWNVLLACPQLIAWEPEQEEEATMVTARPNFQDSVHVGFVSGLKRFTEYLTSVLCFTTPGDGPRSSPQLVRTHEDGRPRPPPCTARLSCDGGRARVLTGPLGNSAGACGTPELQ